MKANCIATKHLTLNITCCDLSKERLQKWHQFKPGEVLFLVLFIQSICWRAPRHKMKQHHQNERTFLLQPLSQLTWWHWEKHFFEEIYIFRWLVLPLSCLCWGVYCLQHFWTQLQVVGRDQHRQTSSDTLSRFGENVEALKKNGGWLIDILYIICMFFYFTGMYVFEYLKLIREQSAVSIFFDMFQPKGLIFLFSHLKTVFVANRTDGFWHNCMYLLWNTNPALIRWYPMIYNDLQGFFPSEVHNQTWRSAQRSTWDRYRKRVEQKKLDQLYLP